MLASIATFAAAAPAQAGALLSSAPSCASESLSQPFLPWADPASYTLAPGGSFEAGSAGWSLSGGAAVTAGNEPFHVTAATDSSSLALPAGSSATSAAVCVDIYHPTIRLFARNGGSALSTLKVEVLSEDATGTVSATPIASVLGGSSWQPTTQIPIVVNLLSLLPGDETAIAFRFTPQGAAGDWHIDDVYVDPYGRS
jgi:hypothetical protein